jgi:hypothetical protein
VLACRITFGASRKHSTGANKSRFAADSLVHRSKRASVPTANLVEHIAGWLQPHVEKIWQAMRAAVSTSPCSDRLADGSNPWLLTSSGLAILGLKKKLRLVQEGVDD